METEVKLTKLADCAGCGAKVGAGTLVALLEGFKTLEDPNLIVGYDTSDDASVYVLDEERALVQTTDFFPPIVDDPYLYGQIAAANAISDIYAMGGIPKLALNIMCVTEKMDDETVKNILRGGYDKAYEAGVIISGGHTIKGSEPIYGLAVSGFADKHKILKNSQSKEGDVLILTKPLGVGIITTAAKADMVTEELLLKIYKQMAMLNKDARDIMVEYDVHGCTDVTGFSLLGHAYEMAQGSGLTITINHAKVPYHKEAYELAQMGFIPAGAYKNRAYVQKGIMIQDDIPLAAMDILFDPQTSGGLLISVSSKDAEKCLEELNKKIPQAAIVGTVSRKQAADIIVI